MGWVAGISENKANSACPAKLELGLGLSMAIQSSYLICIFIPVTFIQPNDCLLVKFYTGYPWLGFNPSLSQYIGLIYCFKLPNAPPSRHEILHMRYTITILLIKSLSNKVCKLG